MPATFFVIGKNGQAYPDLLRRIVNEGHELGNHTFTHPNLGEIPGRLTDLELNATQRLIESVTGRSTVLFRPPYFGDAEADKPEEVEPALRAQQLNYILVGLRIDPSVSDYIVEKGGDWTGSQQNYAVQIHAGDNGLCLTWAGGYRWGGSIAVESAKK